MRVLVIGSGGREHAILRALSSGPEPVTALACPGNAGTAALAENVSAATAAEVLALAHARGVRLAIIGPEQPLVEGLADILRQAGVSVVGPDAAAARLEGSKRFMREVAEACGVPSPAYRVLTRTSEVATALAAFNHVPVVKADGLAAGKGVFLPDTANEAQERITWLLEGGLGRAGRTVVLEERLVGTEASLFFACAGTEAVALPHARDHKRLHDGDRGPNTGGMGAVSPNPSITAALEAEVRERMVSPVLAHMAAAGTPFHGFLFVGIMLTPQGPKLLEFNVRLGDPETQAILPRLADGELLRLCAAMGRGELAGHSVRTRSEHTCAVVLAAAGYPDAPVKGDVLTVDPSLATPDRWLIHAGTTQRSHDVVTAGGRVAAVVARGATAALAREAAYAGVDMVTFRGRQVRRDIGETRE